jgi:hypothetical protein
MHASDELLKTSNYKHGTKFDRLRGPVNQGKKYSKKYWVCSIFLLGPVQSDGAESIQRDILGLAVAK